MTVHSSVRVLFFPKTRGNIFSNYPNVCFMRIHFASAHFTVCLTHVSLLLGRLISVQWLAVRFLGLADTSLLTFAPRKTCNAFQHSSNLTLHSYHATALDSIHDVFQSCKCFFIFLQFSHEISAIGRECLHSKHCCRYFMSGAPHLWNKRQATLVATDAQQTLLWIMGQSSTMQANLKSKTAQHKILYLNYALFRFYTVYCIS